MKYVLAFLFPLLLSLQACQKNQYVVANRTIIINVAPNSWVGSNGGRNYTSQINMPEINNEFNERGGVLAYVSFGNQTYEQLPQVYDGISYTYVTRPGQLILELQSSNGTNTINPPGQTVTLKVILLESEYQ